MSEDEDNSRKDSDNNDNDLGSDEDNVSYSSRSFDDSREGSISVGASTCASPIGSLIDYGHADIDGGDEDAKEDGEYEQQEDQMTNRLIEIRENDSAGSVDFNNENDSQNHSKGQNSSKHVETLKHNYDNNDNAHDDEDDLSYASRSDNAGSTIDDNTNVGHNYDEIDTKSLHVSTKNAKGTKKGNSKRNNDVPTLLSTPVNSLNHNNELVNTAATITPTPTTTAAVCPPQAAGLMGLFQDPNIRVHPTSASQIPIPPRRISRQATLRSSNFSSTQNNPFLASDYDHYNSFGHETEHLLHSNIFANSNSYNPQREPSLQDIFTDDIGNNNSRSKRYHEMIHDHEQQHSMRSQSNNSGATGLHKSFFYSLLSKLPTTESIINSSVGSLLFGLFHVVFCLAQASTISRPYSHRPAIAPMVKIAAMGTIITTPFYISGMVESFPDPYPSIDVFPTPFFVKQALIIDEVLTKNGLGDHDNVFITTFCVVTGIGLILTGFLLAVATKFKLANMGVFLPYPVMAGFFSTVGLLIWTLAFSVDNGGKHIGDIFIHNTDGWNEIKRALFHHVGSIIVAIIMRMVSNIHTSLVPIITICTIPAMYLLLFITRTSMDDARTMGWFWHDRDFETINEDYQHLAPPLPFGVIASLFEGNVHWGAVQEALPVTIAMALIYFIRCSLHAPALKKNANNIQKWKEDEQKKQMNESTDYENLDHRDDSDDQLIPIHGDLSRTYSERPTEKVKTMTMSEVYTVYGKLLALSGLAGGSACLPSIGTSSTIVKLGATGSSPQYGSALVLLYFYLSDFQLLGYIPKITFSSLLVLSAFNMLQDWFFKSYSKIKQKGEWIVVPLIVILSFTIGVLPSVFVGIAISTFIFVGAFYRSPVVKYNANGREVRSTTERSNNDTAWLHKNGDLIQFVVLQNYLFFGNAYSCFDYIHSMFEEPSSLGQNTPKFLIVDFTMVSGIDVSAVDIFFDIISLCRENDCRPFFSSLKQEFKDILKCGGVVENKRKKLYFSSMDSALRNAEDQLSIKEMKRRDSMMSSGEDGFMRALWQIDSQHHMNVAIKLKDLKSYTSFVKLQKYGKLDEDEHKNGLFFIERGVLKVERDADKTTIAVKQSIGSIGEMISRHPRTENRQSDTIMLATIGPGFVVGSLEARTSTYNYIQGIYTAKTDCYLHFLSDEKIDEIEEQNPKLALELYKMMLKLSAERQASTVDQLATLQAIMSSNGSKKPEKPFTMYNFEDLCNNNSSGHVVGRLNRF